MKESEDPEMKKSGIRLLSLVMALLMMVQMSPIAFASAIEDEEPAEEIVLDEFIEDEEPAEAPEEEAEVPEQEEEPEEAAEPEQEEEPAEEAEEAADAVAVSFVFEAEYVLTVTDGKQAVEPASADETTALYLLAPGSYIYTAEVRGHIGTAEGVLEVVEGMEPVTIAPKMESYPYGLPGLAPSAVRSESNLGAKAFLLEHNIPEMLPSMVPGEDYEENTLIVAAETLEEAEAAAAAFGGVLADYNGHDAVVHLNGISVANAVMASLDGSLYLPIAEPCYIVRLTDPEMEETSFDKNAVNANAVYGSTSWRSWWDAMIADGNPNIYPDTYLQNPSSSLYPYALDKMNIYKAWGIVTGDPSVRLAIVDTGVASHVELNSSVKMKGYYSSFGSGNDGQGHGTHCAGIAAAAMGNGNGIAGVAPGVSLYTYKALSDSGSSSGSSVASGIYWAVDTARADVISLSLGGPMPSYSDEQAMKYAVANNATLVIAMGNDGTNSKNFPAGYAVPGLIAVGSTDAANNRSEFSNYGAWCDIYAPGSNILSCGISSTTSYTYKSGTSMATPQVAGACALYMSKFGHKTVLPKDMEKMVKSSKTNGVLDVYKLVSKKYTPKYLGYSVTDGSGNAAPKYEAATRLPSNLGINLESEDMIVYTIDGTYPAFLNGELVNGMVYDGTIRLADFNVGDKVEINAAVTDGEGELGDVLTLSFTIVEPVNEAPVVTEPVAEEPEIEDPTEEAPVTVQPIEEEEGETSKEATASGKIYPYYQSGGYAYTYNVSTRALTTLHLYSTESPNYPVEWTGTITLKDQYGYSVPLSQLTTSSKSINVAYDSNDGLWHIRAIAGKTGTATVKAYDIYGRSTSFKVKVINPVSRIDISPKNPSYAIDVVAVGKSAAMKIALGNAYGNPSIKKVQWVGELFYTNGTNTYSLGRIDNVNTKTNPYFSLNSSGKVTIKKTLDNFYLFGNMAYDFYVDIYAVATDGTGITSNTVRYMIQMPIKFLGIKSGSYLYAKYNATMSEGYYRDFTYGMNGTYYTYNNAVTLSSSNPSVVSVVYATNSSGIQNNTLRVFALKKGTATITVKANDGSGKSCKLKITVR